MSSKGLVARTAVILLLLGAAGVLPAMGAKPPKGSSAVPLNVVLHDSIVDEQDTTAFYNNGIQYCSGSTTAIDTAACSGDSVEAGPTSAYGFPAWTLSGSLTSTNYSHNADCGEFCQRAQISSDLKYLNLDTRGTSPARALKFDFTRPCTDPGCPPAGSATVFGGHLTTGGLLNVFLSFPYTSMAVCSTKACPEAQPAFAKFWFTDPSDASVTWRVDWKYLRVLRMSTTTWYIIADGCDGSQIAGLSKLQGARTRPKEVFNGSYKIPFFLTATLK